MRENSPYSSQYLTNLKHKILFHNKFYFMTLHVSRTCVHHQEVKIALHSLWYHKTYRCDDARGCVMQFWPPDDKHMWYHYTYRCEDTRGCVMQFWPPDDEHMCSKHVEAWNKTYCETKFCASSWLNTEINILKCTVSKTSKFPVFSYICNVNVVIIAIFVIYIV